MKIVRAAIKFLFTPVVVAGFIFDIFSSFFEYGQFRAGRWLTALMRDPEAEKKLVSELIEKTQKQFPKHKVYHDPVQNAVVVEPTDGTDKTETKH